VSNGVVKPKPVWSHTLSRDSEEGKGTEIKELKYSRVISETKNWKRGFEPHPKILPQYLLIALTPVAAVHIGKECGINVMKSVCH
jgi:hypothetical protein